MTIYKFSLKCSKSSNCHGNYIHTTTIHNNFTELCLSSLWSDLRMRGWGHFLLIFWFHSTTQHFSLVGPLWLRFQQEMREFLDKHRSYLKENKKNSKIFNKDLDPVYSQLNCSKDLSICIIYFRIIKAVSVMERWSQSILQGHPAPHKLPSCPCRQTPAPPRILWPNIWVWKSLMLTCL